MKRRYGKTIRRLWHAVDFFCIISTCFLMCNEVSAHEMYHVLHDEMIAIVEENSSFALSA